MNFVKGPRLTRSVELSIGNVADITSNQIKIFALARLLETNETILIVIAIWGSGTGVLS